MGERFYTSEELKKVFGGVGEKKVRAMLKALHSQGKLEIKKIRKKNIIGQEFAIPVYRIKRGALNG